uniref:Uncharacterized protein n=1 Tax=Rhinolophus ferrumequinum TaxID=59479 RepID=A0A671EGB6_RHIFE
MRSILIIPIFSCFFAASNAKIFSKCELARKLKAQGMDGFHGYSLASWVCVAQYESNFNTRAFNGKNGNGSSDYGIFQLNNKWDAPLAAQPLFLSEFLDDSIDDDILCAKRVVKDPRGISAPLPGVGLDWSSDADVSSLYAAGFSLDFVGSQDCSQDVK